MPASEVHGRRRIASGVYLGRLTPRQSLSPQLLEKAQLNSCVAGNKHGSGVHLLFGIRKTVFPRSIEPLVSFFVFHLKVEFGHPLVWKWKWYSDFMVFPRAIHFQLKRFLSRSCFLDVTLHCQDPDPGCDRCLPSSRSQEYSLPKNPGLKHRVWFGPGTLRRCRVRPLPWRARTRILSRHPPRHSWTLRSVGA